MLNNYRIKCSFSFSFVSHSILELLIFSRQPNRYGNDGERTDGVTQYRHIE